MPQNTFRQVEFALLVNNDKPLNSCTPKTLTYYLETSLENFSTLTTIVVNYL